MSILSILGLVLIVIFGSGLLEILGVAIVDAIRDYRSNHTTRTEDDR